jgi:hypothetical protein
MAREDVNIKVSANVAEAIQLWKAMEAGPEGMAKALDSMGQKGKQSTKGIGDELAGMVGKWTSVAGAIAIATEAIQQQREAVRQLRQERVETTNTIDEAWNRFQVQAGIPQGPQADRVRTQILSTAAQRKFAPVPALVAAEQLGSAGASVQDILGGGLDEFLQLLTASNAAGQQVDSGEMARAMVLFLEANKLRPDRAGMRPTSLAIQQLFGGTNLQLSNLARFAPEAGTIAKYSGLKPEEQLAIYSQFLGTMDEARGATSFRSGVVSLASAGGTMEKTAALKMLGLKPQDVDFQGEDFATVVQRLTKAFGAVPGEQRNIAAKKLFGQESLGFYNVMLQEGAIEESQRRTEMARSEAGARERLGIAESGRAAQAREAEALAANALYQQGVLDPEVIKKRLRALAAQEGLSEAETAAVQARFENPYGAGFGWMFPEPTTEFRARRAAGRLVDLSDQPYISTRKAEQERYEQAIGQQEITIRIKTADGLDLPSEVEAANLSQPAPQPQQGR